MCTTDQKWIYKRCSDAHGDLLRGNRSPLIKALTSTGWGKQKETLMATYKANMRPALEYASSIWLPLTSSTSINKLQLMQNAALRTATGCTQDTNIHSSCPCTSTYSSTRHNTNRKHNIHHTPYTNIQHVVQHSNALKNTIFNNGRYTTNFPHTPHNHYTIHKNKHAPYTYIYCL